MISNITSEQATKLEKAAEQNDGHCDRCGQTIKIYRYKVNSVHVRFLRAIAEAVEQTGVNNVDVGTLGLPYSTRTQSSKLRQHGLIARFKDERGVQAPRRWLITHKGWQFLNGGAIPSTVVVYNNQVIGHDLHNVTIHEIAGELTPPVKQYDETPVTPAEARVYEDVRAPQKKMQVRAKYRRAHPSYAALKTGHFYDLEIDRLQVGAPVKLTVVDLKIKKIVYHDINAFRKDWEIIRS